MYVRCFTKTDSWNEWMSLKEMLAIEIKQIVEKNKATIDSSKVAGTVFTIISEIATPPAME